MPRIKETQVFKFDELDDRAKERARDWYRNGALDYEWWDCTFDDAKQCLALAGFDLDKIYFSGFSSQGDGACFNGAWHANKAQPVKAMKQHAPKDTELHAIAAEARAIAKLRPNASMSVKQRGHYYHSGCTEFGVDCERESDDVSRTTAEWEARGKEDDAIEERVIEMSRDAMNWIYRRLEAEYEWLMSDEQVDESITANDYEFTEEGKRA
jgi:hypothetical protein